ncbi:citrate-binding protein-like [Pistacia vera]|uniref:citrate-binding protein-like n=1 Tax=Pistacia vera TaxID=55513 RepID=UPI001263105B|nr:citrate-binding protein-like [Pistacia vera]
MAAGFAKTLTTYADWALPLGALLNSFNQCHADPTDGFCLVPLTQSNFKLQKPYDTPFEQSYLYENGVHKLWVYADDKPHDPNSHTQPRIEIRIQCLDYSSEVWQFEGYGFVSNGTSGATIAQIHGAAHGAATFILRIYDGDMRYYSRDLVATSMYDKWFRLNVIHDVDGGTVTVYINGVQKYSTNDKGPGSGMYFKCGVYATLANISFYMESMWRDIKIHKN